MINFILIEVTYFITFLYAVSAFFENMYARYDKHPDSSKDRFVKFVVVVMAMVLYGMLNFYFSTENMIFSFGMITFFTIGMLGIFVREIFKNSSIDGIIAFSLGLFLMIYEYLIYPNFTLLHIDKILVRPNPIKGILVGLFVSLVLFHPPFRGQKNDEGGK